MELREAAAKKMVRRRAVPATRPAFAPHPKQHQVRNKATRASCRTSTRADKFALYLNRRIVHTDQTQVGKEKQQREKKKTGACGELEREEVARLSLVANCVAVAARNRAGRIEQDAANDHALARGIQRNLAGAAPGHRLRTKR